MRRWKVHADDPSIQVQFRRLELFDFCVHTGETMAGGVSFVRFDLRTAISD
jgi:hypothetical protein